MVFWVFTENLRRKSTPKTRMSVCQKRVKYLINVKTVKLRLFQPTYNKLTNDLRDATSPSKPILWEIEWNLLYSVLCEIIRTFSIKTGCISNFIIQRIFFSSLVSKPFRLTFVSFLYNPVQDMPTDDSSHPHPVDAYFPQIFPCQRQP